ncbi:GNAT family N-acetyltransferase [Roseobacter weihaiensis]|uniref:GNAT family N-acetyltransferase n=1 Tax=Roseobacter weihaiensis TaxID=2763262 RepID=UPI001D0B86F7|nr:GNAT family N-acetyltransferase [Roseobacter sp. H9]
MQRIEKGRYVAFVAQSDAQIAAAQALRALTFGGGVKGDKDRFDGHCLHFLIEDRENRSLVCCFRVLTFGGPDVVESYSAQHYDLSALAVFKGPMAEIGRFCVDPSRRDPDILRLAWAVMTDYVDRRGVQLLFGCSSFDGTETAPYQDAFAVLSARHTAPARWCPGIKSPEVFLFDRGGTQPCDLKKANKSLPPLLRSYLSMGAWVSDHAVVDRALNTLHVFTALEVTTIQPARKRLLRALLQPASGGSGSDISGPNALGH